MDSFKHRNFLLGGVLLMVVQLALKHFMADSVIRWDVRVENMFIPIAVAWANERYAQKKIGITLEWFGSGERFLSPFLWSIGAWTFFLWLAVPDIFESRSPLRFFSNIGAIYLFAGAFFEISNLIKVRVKK